MTIGIRYLTQYAAATNPAGQRAEWPPHFGRVFMAMAAAHFESESDSAERIALEWLEAAEPPCMRASDADERTAVRTYVPVNDEHKGIFGRPRQDRAFPRARPHDECVYFIWDAAPPAEIRGALESVCAKVTRVGHSSSAVQMWVVPQGQEPKANWLPTPGSGDLRLRVTGAGTLRSLEKDFNATAIQEYEEVAELAASAKGREKARLKREIEARFPEGRPERRWPHLVHWQGYSRPAATEQRAEVVDGPFDPEIVVLAKIDGPALGLESTLQLTTALRNCAMDAAGNPVPEWISGHDGSGMPSQRPHLAFFPLPYVGFEYADGHVMGLGIAIPRDVNDPPGTRAQRLRACLGPLFFNTESGEEREIRLWRNGYRPMAGGRTPIWEWRLGREKRERPPQSLQRLNWTRPSRVWASVTPVVLHHYPKKRDGEVERILREAFVSALYPDPEWVGTRSVSLVAGAGHAMAQPPFTEGGASLCRYQTHVVARFATPVRGPLLVGRGRYRGYGLLKPVTDEEAEQWMR
jgi:CRISPR-associated protein Csb2